MHNGMVFSSVLHVALVALLLYGLPEQSHELTLGGGSAVPVVFESASGQSGQANERPALEPPQETATPNEPAAPELAAEEPPAAEAPEVESLLTAEGTPDQPSTPPQAPPEVPIAKPSLAAPEQVDLALVSQPESPDAPASQDEQLDSNEPAPPELPDGPSLEVVTAPVTQPVPQADSQPVEEVVPDPLSAPETSPTLTENPSEVAQPTPAPQVATELAPPEPTLQTSPDLLAETDNPEPDEVAPEISEAPEPIPEPTAERVEELLEPEPEAPTSSRPGPEVPSPEEIPAPPSTQVATVPEPTTAPTPPAPAEATALQPALAVPVSAPKRDITLPETQPAQQQTASAQTNTGRQEQTTRSDNAADSLISNLASGGGTQQAAAPSGSTSRSSGATGRLSRSDEDKVRRAVSNHWNVPCGQRGIRDLEVSIRLQMRQDGSVARWEIVDRGRYNGDPTFRSVADSAVRAIQQAQPLPFPRNNYGVWRDVKLNFSPRDVC